MKHWGAVEYFFQLWVAVLAGLGVVGIFHGFFMGGDFTGFGLVLVFTAAICEFGLIFPADAPVSKTKSLDERRAA